MKKVKNFQVQQQYTGEAYLCEHRSQQSQYEGMRSAV